MADEPIRLLVVEDDPSINDLLASALRFRGFTVEVAATGFDAVDAVARLRPHLVLLDVNLPGIDGFEVCRRLRAGGDHTPVIFLTARDTDQDALAGFTAGGDDYVTKPFSLEVVVARVEAVLRRGGIAGADAEQTLRYRDIEIDEAAHRVRRAGETIELSRTEFTLLRYLVANAERVLSRGQILDHVWGFEDAGDSSLETYISYLRKKVDTGDPKLIQTVRGIGYVLRGPET